MHKIVCAGSDSRGARAKCTSPSVPHLVDMPKLAGPAACRSCSANCRRGTSRQGAGGCPPHCCRAHGRSPSRWLHVGWDSRMASWTTFGRSPWATGSAAANNSFSAASSSRRGFKYSFRVPPNPALNPFRVSRSTAAPRQRCQRQGALLHEVGALRRLVARGRGGPGDAGRGARQVWLGFLAQDPWTSTCEPHGSAPPFCKS